MAQKTRVPAASSGMIFKHGEILKKVSEDEIVPELLKEIEKM